VRYLALVFVALWVLLGLLAVRHARQPAAAESGLVEAIPEESVGPASLVWLARHQAADGHWSGSHFMEECQGKACSGASLDDDDEELTGLCLLGFLGAGYTPQNRQTFLDPHSRKTVRYGEVVGRGVAWLIGRQNAEGMIRTRFSPNMKAHAVAATALCEAYGITNAVSYRGPAERAVAFIASACDPEHAWGDDATNVECAMALKSAQISSIDVITSDVKSAVLAWAKRPTNDPAEAAYRLISRIFFEKKKGDGMRALAGAIVAHPVRWEDRAFHVWEYETLSLFQLEGPMGPAWKSWSKPVADTLCSHQAIRKDGCADGSWDGPCGRVRATAEATLTLEIYYRYEAVFGSKK
jgi:hypothetical protein